LVSQPPWADELSLHRTSAEKHTERLSVDRWCTLNAAPLRMPEKKAARTMQARL